MRARGRGAARMASQTSSKASACSPTLTAVSGARPGAAAARSSAGGVGGSGRPAPAPAVGGAFWGLGARAVRGPRHRHAHGIPPLLPALAQLRHKVHRPAKTCTGNRTRHGPRPCSQVRGELVVQLDKLVDGFFKATPTKAG